MTSELVTLLFTDVVGSTELLSRAGEEEAQRIFRLHRHLLTGTVALHGGHEVKWLGDGLMVAFPSAAEAIACAIAMQQTSREPVEGEHLGVRVGLNVGEALREVDDYFGTPVVIARRLCDSAEGGQIRSTQMVADLMAGRAGFSFTVLGRIELKGIPEPVAACEVHYEVASGPAALPARPAMVGREAEFGRLTERVAQAALGQGGLATLTGEPGIGKTRMLESPSRQMRLHRKVAQVLEEAYGDIPTPAQAAEIASQYHRSATLSGAERGVEPALVAASHAQSTGAHDEAATFLRMALDMLPEGDERRPRLLGRLGNVLAWSLAFEEAVETIVLAGDAIAHAEGERAAAEYLSDAAYVCAMAGGIMPSWRVAHRGLTYTAEHDATWARLLSFDEERRAAEAPEHAGIPIDNADRREAARILRAASLDPLGPAPVEGVVDSRAEALESSNLVVLMLWAGEYSRCLPLFEAEAIEAESLGRVARAARAWGGVAACHAALGNLPEAREALDRALGHAARLGAPLPFALYTQDALALPRHRLGGTLCRRRAARRSERPSPRLGQRVLLGHGGAGRHPPESGGRGHGAGRPSRPVDGASTGVGHVLPALRQPRRRDPLGARPPRPRGGDRTGAARKGDRT
jgi:class 3 adenylate cyclase/tetratricopeptide (TPR) repeat protein